MTTMATMPVSLMNPNQAYLSCIDACTKCAQICEECFALCLEEPDVKMRTVQMKELLDCANICSLSACAMSRRSHHSKDFCNLCATICDRCAQECASLNDSHSQQCAEVCRSCADECRKMANM